MEIVVVWFAELVLSLALGFGGGWAHYRYRIWKIQRHAPSAEVVGFHVSLTQQDYDHLPKKDDDVAYFIVDRNVDAKGPLSSPSPAR